MILSGIGGLLVLLGFLFGYAGIAASETSESAYQGNTEAFFVLTGLGILLVVGGWLLHTISGLRQLPGGAAILPTAPPPAGPTPVAPAPPPPLVAPPATEEKECEMRADMDPTNLRAEVDVSEAADPSYKGRAEEIEEAIEGRITERRTYSAEDWGTAVAISDGPAVGGSVAAGSILSTLKGSQTETVKAEEDGHTDVQLSIRAPEGARTQISAAVLTAVEAKASVLEVPEDLFEQFEIANWTVAFTEAVMRIVGREEWVEIFVETFGRQLTVEQKAKFLKSILKWREELLGELRKNPKEAAKKGKILIKELQEITKTHIGKVIRITRFLKFIFTEFAAVIIEKGGAWLLRNAEVEVRVEGSMDFEIGECTVDNSKIFVEASRKLELQSGELEEPADHEFERRAVKHALASCSAEDDMVVHVEGEVGADGSAKYDGDGYANFNSLWAVAWVLCCQHGDPSDGASYHRENESGYTWGGWFKLPDEVRENFPSDLALADAGEMRAYVTNLIGGKLKALVEAEFGGGKASPCDDPKLTEARLKASLQAWYQYVQEEFKLFEEPPDAPPPRTVAR